MLKLVTTIEITEAGADVQAAAELIVTQGMQAKTPRFWIGGGIETAVRVELAIHANFTLKTAYFTTGRLQVGA
nr:hypothetical protein [Pseudomonas mucidolens]